MSEDKRMQLMETGAAFVTPKPILESVSTPRGKRLRVRGIYQRVDSKNENNRRYPKSVWLRNLAEDSVLMQRMARRTVLGELEHPESGVTHLGRVSHLIESVSAEALEEDNEFGVDAGEYLIGSHLVLNTPPGLILQELYEVEIPVGISSRGRGDVMPDTDGVDVVQDNYDCDTFDCVYQPSVVEATPKPVSDESTKRKRFHKNIEALVEDVSSTVKGTTTAELADLVELCSQVSIALEEAHGVKVPSDQKMIRLLEDCGTRLAKLVEQTVESATKLKPEAESDIPKKEIPMKSAEQEQTMTQTSVAQVVANMAERTVRAETIANRLQTPRKGAQRMRPRRRLSASRQATKTGQPNSRRYAALLEVANGLLNKGRKLQKTNTSLSAKCEAAVQLADGLAKRVKRSGVGELVDAAITEAPALQSSRKLLLECKTVNEVADKINLLTSVLPSEHSPDSAPAVEGIRVPAGRVTESNVPRATNLSSALFRLKGV